MVGMKDTGAGLKAAVALMIVAVLAAVGVAMASARPGAVDLGPLIAVNSDSASPLSLIHI